MINLSFALASSPLVSVSNTNNLRGYCHKYPSILKGKSLEFRNFVHLEKAQPLINCTTLGAKEVYQIIDDGDILEPIFQETSQIKKNIRRIDQASGFLKAAKISEQRIKELQDRALVLEAHHTTHIEGTNLSLYQSKKLLGGKKVQNVSPDDVQELLNYKTAFDQVAKSIDAHYPLNEVFIRDMHKLLVANVRGDYATPGEYRVVQNFVSNSETNEVIHTPPACYQVPSLMSKLIKWINDEKDMHPVLVAAIAQFQLVHIHPFLDGNGRVARLLSTLCLYRSGYDFKQLFTISEYYDKNRAAYYKAIQDVRDNGMDLTGWLEYFTLGLSLQMSDLERKCEEIMNLELGQSLEKISDEQKMSLESLNSQIGETIKKYISLRPFIDREKLKNEIFSLVEADL